MGNFVFKELINNDIENELIKIGFDKSYCFHVSDKFRYKNIKIYNLTPEQANIIKQSALSVGADCGTHKEVIKGKIDCSNVILGGSISQLKKITEKLKQQPFKLKELAQELEDNLEQNNQTQTKLVGILNVTPDSFSDGGKYFEPKEAQKHLVQLIEDGADVIDIGAESTKPFSNAIEANEQINRLKDILNFVQKKNIKIPISVDTRSSVVADFALNNGASIINDVSGFDYDDKLAEVVAKYKASVIIQHSNGTPIDMQDNPTYEDVVEEVFFSLKNKIEYANSLGINDITIDVGIGFGKTKEHNFELIHRIEEFKALNHPIMIGISRKSFIGVSEDNNELKDALTAAISYQLIQKVDYLRVHNIKLHRVLLNSLSAIKTKNIKEI